ncbi:UPF0692 protein C19orf54 [Thrips palmi]|uniref:Actin maturation protease n=1 Tax=Thrips palmi TaxID=161013 RepID=A0A6P8ZYE9_THRPL|nr:UPF0692 protein C19orf54 [Thrips palmi]XP_034250447.1 UPF0692 protein C19orf54 [Thrips palmi]XP_034250448.1 UPF0692 protein C19orf54 [Thrips palmi]
MSSTVPVPPPPLAPPSTFQSGKERVSPLPTHQLSDPKNEVLYEPNAEQELVDTRNRLWELEGWKDTPLLTVYQYIPPILQNGPQCGLVALAMAAAAYQTLIPVQKLLHEAQMRGYSYRGEMFSVDDMASLALASIPNISIQVINGLLEKRDTVVHSLARGGILLVPYDADRNHQPCCRKGHKAHWAAVCGALVCSDKCLLAARQGKSRRLMMWDYVQLAASNNNLVEFSPERGEDSSKYLLPEGGVQAGLCGRAIILQCL